MTSPDTSNEPLDFDRLADLCLQMGCFQSPSVFHGVLVGQLCSTQPLSAAHWELLFGQLLGEQQQLDANGKALAQQLLQQTQESLSDGQLNFEPLLPGELYELEERFAALIKWIQGFRKSLKAAGIKPEQLSKEAAEGLDDLVNIEKQASTQLQASEDNEKDLTELVEFVRLLAIMIYLETHPGQPQVEQPQEQPTLH